MTEQQPYQLVTRYPHFELRRYPEHAVAEVQVTATFDPPFKPWFLRHNEVLQDVAER